MRAPLTILMTGAHVTPAVALAQAVIDVYPNAKIIYVGRSIGNGELGSIERVEIERVGGQFRAMTSGKLHRFVTPSQILEFVKFPIGVAQAMRLAVQEKPDVTVSFGGYLSVPVIMASKVLGIPIVIHEETAAWGLANRICRRWANAVAVSWSHMEEPGVILTGNPVPKEIAALSIAPLPAKKKNILYITEGSQASLAISKAVQETIGRLLEHFEIYHQTKYPASVKGASRYYASRWFSTPEHAAILSKASLAVSRAGANTVTYHVHAGLPTIFIPLPYAGANEQMKNARMLAETGLARIIPQSELSPERFFSEIMEFSKQPDEAKKESQVRARKLIIVDASVRFRDLVLSHVL